MRNLIPIIGLFFLMACNPGDYSSENGAAVPVVEKMAQKPVKLSDYWYQGKAEVNRYTLEQNRYKDVHPGDAILVFVTEDFLTDKQVKNDNYTNPNSTPILKNNHLREFTTGIYKYTMMNSVFTPVKVDEFPHTLKTTTSSQEWCGQVFMQLNYHKNKYETQVFSYFENEGDIEAEVPAALLEDEVFNRIRMNPGSLPVGEVEMLPSTFYVRLQHQPFKPMKAKLSKSAYTGEEFTGDNLQSYRIEYPDLQRTLEIVYEGAEPYRIAGWKDAYPSIFDKKIRTTIARRTHTLMTPYWQQNSLADTALRKELGL